MTRPLLTPLEAVVLNRIRIASTQSPAEDRILGKGATLGHVAEVVRATGHGPLSTPLAARTIYRLGRRGFVVRARQRWLTTGTGVDTLIRHWQADR